QASSRSFLARITPPESAGENFGLYATTGRAVSFLGPAMFAGAIMVFGFQRAGTLGILLVLALGLALIIPVRPDAPRRSLQGQLPAPESETTLERPGHCACMVVWVLRRGLGAPARSGCSGVVSALRRGLGAPAWSGSSAGVPVTPGGALR